MIASMTEHQPEWDKCSTCNLDGTYKCKVAAETIKSIEDCPGPFGKEKKRRRRRRNRR